MEKINLKSVKMGSDAEVFLKDASGRFFPACGIIGGTKEKPLVLDKDGTAVQEDNVMLEFNTAVASSSKEWVANIQKAQQLAFAKIPPTMHAVCVGSAHFDPALLQCPQAQTFGCEPDYNAWTMEQNPRPDPQDPTLRTAAAHVHISWDNPADIEQRCRIIKLADIFVVLPTMGWSEDKERRKLYGKAGAFRPKKYGVEHRVMDNGWMVNRDYMRNIWHRYMQTLAVSNTDYDVSKDRALEIQTVINNYDQEGAARLYTEEYYKVQRTLDKHADTGE